MAVRPTSDRVKEALFSMLTSRFDLTRTMALDLFAGTGSIGIEALSRGADRVVFVEQHRAARGVLEANVEACGFAERVEVLSVPVRDALRVLEARGAQFGGVFLDPPYRKGLLVETVERLGHARILKPGSWVMVERHIDDELAEAYGALRLTQTRRYGKTALSLYCVARETEQGRES
jgi:16S rRNA (guanine(966)-N(2))-methyltransferase RsmD